MKKFSKAKWREQALKDKEAGVITQADIDNAEATWVNSLDGKPYEEATDNGKFPLNEKWFE